MRCRNATAAVALALAFSLYPLAIGAQASADTPSPTATSTDCSPTGPPQYVNSVPTALDRLDASQSWQIATGAGVIVAVVDSGVDASNAHFAGALVPGTDVLAGSTDAGRTDVTGHGTAIAGEIAARRVANSGVIGLAPDAKIMPVRVFVNNDPNTGTPVKNADIAAGIIYAANHQAKIINVSLSTTVDDPVLHQAVIYALNKGALVVASGGNRDTATDKQNTPRYPGAYPEALSVAAVDADDNITDDSIHGSFIDVAAPGTNILTTYFAAGDCVISSNQPATSFATAYVSAAAALLAQQYPGESPLEWKYRLEVTAQRDNAAQRDDNVGWGIIRPHDALTYVDDGHGVGPSDGAHTPIVHTPSASASLALGQTKNPLTHSRHLALVWGFGGAAVVLALLLASMLRRGGGARRR